MRLKTVLFIFGMLLLILPLINAAYLDIGTVLNTSSSNSSMTFSINVTVNLARVELTSIFLETVWYIQNHSTRFCEYINFTTPNVNLDSKDFGCPIFVRPPGGSSGPSTAGSLMIRWRNTITISEEDFINGLNVSLREKWRCKTSIDDNTYYIGVFDLTSTTVTASIGLQEKVISIGEEWKVDVNNDNYYDVLVKLNSIKGYNADLYIKKIHEVATAKTVGKAVDFNDKEPNKEPKSVNEKRRRIVELELISQKKSIFSSIALLIGLLSIIAIMYYIVSKIF
jgi:hypothetical protein